MNTGMHRDTNKPIADAITRRWTGDEQLHELLAERALDTGVQTADSDASAAAEAERSAVGATDEIEALELAAASILLAELDADDLAVPMPDAARQTTAFALQNAHRGSPAVAGTITGTAENAQTVAAGGNGWFATMGWLAAAAAIVFAVVIAANQPTPAPEADTTVVEGPQIEQAEPTLAERVESLENLDGTVESTWAEWTQDDPASPGFDLPAGATGKVVWNNSRQEGYMVFEGLPSNDPSVFQYQLWIIDPSQKQPIDGGVFDIADADDGRVIVPIDPKIRVDGVAAFGVTAEKPGGVVVSDQNQRVVVAPIG